MCSIAAPRVALGFGATAFPDRRRGVAAVAPLARGVMAREPARRAGAEAFSAARSQKRARDNSLDVKTRAREVSAAAGEVSVVVPAPGQRRLQERMKAELEAVRDLHTKAVLLCRGGAGRSGAAPTGKGDVRLSAAGSRREAEAKRRKTFLPSKPTMEAAQQIKAAKKQQPPVQRAAPLPPPEREMEKSKELQKRHQQMEEIARAREECRQEVLDVEMAKLPDEIIHPQDWEELGIAEFEYAFTRTRSQAQLQDLGRE